MIRGLIYQPLKLISITIGLWLAGTIVYCYYWVTSISASPDTYGYEKWPIFPFMGFLVYRFPYLLVGLVGVIIVEFIVAAVFIRKALPGRDLPG